MSPISQVVSDGSAADERRDGGAPPPSAGKEPVGSVKTRANPLDPGSESNRALSQKDMSVKGAG